MQALYAFMVALAGVAIAVPISSSANATTSKHTFSLAMQVGYGNAIRNLTLFALPASPTTGALLLVGGGDSPATVGTPVYTNGTSPNATLTAIYTDGERYGIRAADVGDNYGLVTDVTATKSDEDPAWYVGNGEVYHKLYAGSNLLMACNQTIGTEEKYVLSFGVVTSEGSIPDGCQYTRVFTVCNQPHSHASC